MSSYRRNIPLLKSIAHKLAEIRKSKGLSQADVYIDTDLNIGHIEAGRKNVTISSLAILCKYAISQYAKKKTRPFKVADRLKNSQKDFLTKSKTKECRTGHPSPYYSSAKRQNPNATTY